MTFSVPTLANIALLAALLAYTVRLVGRARRSRSWTTVQATVVDSRAIRRGRGFVPRIEFTYVVGGCQYKGQRRWVGPTLRAAVDKQWAEDIVAAAPIGSTVAVAVDPADPAYAVLLPGLRGAHWVVVAVTSLVVGGWSIGMLVIALLRSP